MENGPPKPISWPRIWWLLKILPPKGEKLVQLLELQSNKDNTILKKNKQTFLQLILMTDTI